MKQFIISFLCIFLSVSAMATGGGDDGKEKGGKSVRDTLQNNEKPNIPGDLVIDLGFNLMQSTPEDMSLGIFGSKTVNLYYTREINLWKSKFSIVPGIGLGLEKYKFDNDITIVSDDGDTEIESLSSYLSSSASPRNSKLAANYIDIPVELRFTANKSNPGSTFKASIGGRAGFLYSAHTKVKYEEDGEVRTLKDKQIFNLNRFRYGVQGRIGIGGVNLFYYHNLSELFQSNSAPDEANITTITAGISITGF